MRNQSKSTINKVLHQSRFAALIALFLCLILNTAYGNINLTAGRATSTFDTATHRQSSGFLSKKSTTTRDSIKTDDAVGSNFEGAVVLLDAGNNVNIKGSSVVSDQLTAIKAGNDVNILADTNTRDESHFNQTKKSGFTAMQGGGINVGYSANKTATTATSGQTTAAGSLVGSTGAGGTAGNVIIQAGGTYRQTGSDVMTPAGDIDIAAKRVEITEARETTNNQSRTDTQSAASTYTNKTSGISVGISIPGMSQVQSAQAMASNVGKVTDTRMKAMGAAVAANNAVNAAKSIASGAGLAPSITIGASTSKTSQASQTNSSTSQGSSITGTNVSVSATGKDLDGNLVDKTSNAQSGNLLVQGSKVAGTAATAISATGDIDLLAGQSTSTTTTNNSSKSAGASVSMSMAGVPTGGSVNASRSNGNSNEQSTTYTNTQIGNGVNSAGTGSGSNPNSTLTISSGGNTTLTGATASANQVTANIAGNLTITSVQDTYSYVDKSKSSGISVSGGSGGVTGGSITAGKSNTNASYTAVTEQSGLKAGDAGFQVAVGGQTSLTGAVITSTDKAVNATDKDANGQPKPRNSFQSAGGVTATDLTNTSSYKASSASITAGVGSSLSSSGAGTGNAKGNETSTTVSGISGVNVTNNAVANTATGAAVNSTVRTDDKANPSNTPLANTFAQNKDAIKANVTAQVQITQQFGQAASKAIGDLGDKKLAEAKALKDQAAQAQKDGDPAKAQALTNQANDIESNWKEGGTLRVLAHTLTGGLTGNLAGAAGAATSQTLVPMLGEQLANSTLPLELKQGLLQIAAIAIGTAAGGGSVAGAASAQNATANNYLSHKPPPNGAGLSEKQRYENAVANCPKDPEACKTRDELAGLSARRDQELQQACGPNGNKGACEVQIAQVMAGNTDKEGNLIQGTIGGAVYANSTDRNSVIQNLNVQTVGAAPNPLLGTYQGQQALNMQPAILAGAGGAPLLIPRVALGASLGAGADAAGQYTISYVQTGEGTIRPVQSLVAGLTGSIALPLTVGRGVLVGTAGGAATAGANTAFNNWMYGENTNVGTAAFIGGIFGGIGSSVGSWLTNNRSYFPTIPAFGTPPNIPARPPLGAPYAPQIGNAASNSVGAIPSFIPLDNNVPANGRGKK